MQKFPRTDKPDAHFFPLYFRFSFKLAPDAPVAENPADKIAKSNPRLLHSLNIE